MEYKKGIEDPIIINNSKEQIAKPYNKKDIEKIAYDVLADLGDEVINKAIEDGKITLPQNIDVASLPHINLNTAQTLELKEVWNKCFYDVNSEQVFYPGSCDENHCYYFNVYAADDGINNGLVSVALLEKSGNDIDSSVYSYDLYDLTGTRLYKHEVEINVDDGNAIFQLSIVSNDSTPIDNNQKFINILGYATTDVFRIKETVSDIEEIDIIKWTDTKFIFTGYCVTDNEQSSHQFDVQDAEYDDDVQEL